MNEPEFEPDRPRFTGFLPLFLLALSLIVAFAWELNVSTQLRRNGEQLREQQTKLVEQSKNVQTSLEKLARDLIEVAQTDDDAKAIVAKYNINISNPAPAPSAAK